MCRKLFATNIVASNFFGLFNKLVIIFAFDEELEAKSERSLEVSEKNATSDAATIAQQKSNSTIPIIPNSKLVSMVSNKRKLGSESKL